MLVKYIINTNDDEKDRLDEHTIKRYGRAVRLICFTTILSGRDRF